MNLFGDLKSANAMYLKAVLFLVAGVLCFTGLLLQSPDLRTAFLLAVLVWSFCRFYYFLFYVIEHYIDPDFHFSGLLPAIAYLLKRRAGEEKMDRSFIKRE